MTTENDQNSYTAEKTPAVLTLNGKKAYITEFAHRGDVILNGEKPDQFLKRNSDSTDKNELEIILRGEKLPATRIHYSSDDIIKGTAQDYADNPSLIFEGAYENMFLEAEKRGLKNNADYVQIDFHIISRPGKDGKDRKITYSGNLNSKEQGFEYAEAFSIGEEIEMTPDSRVVTIYPALTYFRSKK